MTTGFNEILKSFTTISLEEMDCVKLMNRTDTKFVFNICCLPEVLKEMASHYRVLMVNGIIPSRYETLYFDSDRFDFYKQHHNGKSNRYKIRYRQYVESDLNFFEIKFRSNKGRTIKERVRRKKIHEEIEGKATDLLTSITPLEPAWLKPQIWVYYKRMTFVNKTANERLTIDFELCFRDKDKSSSYPGLVIAEVKQEKEKISPFIAIMKKRRISSDSISKYCLGMMSLKENMKTNRFKMKLKTINKLCHDKN